MAAMGLPHYNYRGHETAPAKWLPGYPCISQSIMNKQPTWWNW